MIADLSRICKYCSMDKSSLICELAEVEDYDINTTETEKSLCLECYIGQVHRDKGCNNISGRIVIRYGHTLGFNNKYYFEEIQMFCQLKGEDTDIDSCKACNLINAETTDFLASNIQTLFEENGFKSAQEDFRKAREKFFKGDYDGCLTSSIACAESVMRIIHQKKGIGLPTKPVLTTLWDSTKKIFKNELDSLSLQVCGNISGLMTALGGFRNEKSDAHGDDNASIPPEHFLAELGLNSAATLSTFLLRLYIQNPV